MIGHSRGQALAAYQTVATHGGVAAADPHGLVLMLLDGLFQRVAAMRLAVLEGDYNEKARMANRALLILDELRGSLDFEAGGEVARNLDGLYDYCGRQIVQASVSLRAELLDEVSRLVNHIRATWLTVRAAAERG
jgi:flagellar protein FliS